MNKLLSCALVYMLILILCRVVGERAKENSVSDNMIIISFYLTVFMQRPATPSLSSHSANSFVRRDKYVIILFKSIKIEHILTLIKGLQ